MHPNPLPKPIQAASNLLLLLLAGNLIANSNFLLKLTGVMVGLGTIGIHRKQDLSDQDYLQGIGWVAGNVSEGVKDLSSELMPSRKQLRSLYIRLKEPQPMFKTKVQLLAEQLLQDAEWFESFTRRSKIICGNTGDGKTTLQLYDVAIFLNQHPDGHLTICDMDYGSSHEGSEPNYWFDLPRDRYIRVTYEEIRDAILDEYEIMEKRAKASAEGKGQNWQWRMLTIDEAIAVLRRAKQLGEEKELTNAIAELLFRGLKQRIKISFGVQVLAVGENGLSLALQKQVNMILLGSAAVDTENLTRIGVSDTKGLVEKVRATRRMPGCQYAAVTRIKGELSLRVVPEIDPSEIQVEVPPDDDLEQWWNQVYTPEVQAWFAELADRYVAGEIKSPLKSQICRRFELKALRSDAKYCKVAEAWDQAKRNAQAVKPKATKTTKEANAA